MTLIESTIVNMIKKLLEAYSPKDEMDIMEETFNTLKQNIQIDKLCSLCFGFDLKAWFEGKLNNVPMLGVLQKQAKNEYPEVNKIELT